MTMQLYHLTFALAAIAVILEITLPSFLFLGFAIGLAATGVVHFVSGEFSLSRDLLIFGSFSALGFGVLRKFFGKAKDARDADSDVNQY